MEKDSFIGLYQARATHTRHEEGQHQFTGILPYVRVSLPEVYSRAIKTPIGAVVDTDHLLFSKSGLRTSSFAEQHPDLVNAVSRLELLTVARKKSEERFNALSIFLGYGEKNELPSFYILEACLGNGEPRQLYFAADIHEPLITPTGYRATPFSRETHYYRCLMGFDGMEIRSLQMEAFKTDPRESNQLPYVTVDLQLQRSEMPEGSPNLIAKYEAPMRFATIAKAKGVELKTLEHKAFAVAGEKFLKWNKKPEKRTKK